MAERSPSPAYTTTVRFGFASFSPVAKGVADLYADVSGKPVKLRQLSDAALVEVLVGIGTAMPFAMRALTR